MVYNGILMETIVISVMVSFGFYCFFSRGRIQSTNGRIHFKVDTMKSLQTQNMI